MKIVFKNLENNEVLNKWELNPSQERFWKSKGNIVLFSGGFGCGKSLTLVLKAIELALKYPGNFILMGRRTYPELRDSLIKQFFINCPDHLIKEYLKAETRVIFKNGSEIVFRHLDTMAESELRSINLGCAFIDQAEDISREVVLAIVGRLRHDKVPKEDRKIFMSANPKLTWLYQDFKENIKEGYELIEASTMENAKFLPDGYIENMMKYPESWKRQYVYGIWDKSLLSDNIVFAREYIEKLMDYAMDPLRTVEGLEIYKEFVPGHKYQMGIDSSEGKFETGVSDERQKSDESAITITDLTNEEEVASFSARIPPDILGEKAAYFAKLYENEENRILIIPEMNSIGLALINKLKEFDLRLYRRTEEDKIMKVVTEKIGWRTTSATKPLLITRFQERLRLTNPKIYSRKTIEQFKSFVYTDAAHQSGMGAEHGFHDDRLISLLLSFWQPGKIQPGQVFSPSQKESAKSSESFLEMRGGKLRIRRDLTPQLQIEKKWTI